MGQQMVMTPQLRQAVKLLTLNHLELQAAIQEELVENPVLEEIEHVISSDNEKETTIDQISKEIELVQNKTEQSDEIDWQAYADSFSYLPPNSQSAGHVDDMPGYDQTLTRNQTLDEHLIWQIQMANFNAIEREIAIRILGEIDDDGYLSQRDDIPAKSQLNLIQLIADETEMPIEWIESVRQKIMRLDPVGCGSKSLQELLLTQLDVWGYDDECVEFLIIRDHFSAYQQKKYKEIAKSMSLTLDDMREAKALISRLEPRPARNFLKQGDVEGQEHISPDIFVKKVGDDVVISMNEDGVPRLKISPTYIQKLAEAQRGDPSNAFLKDRMRAATWLIRSIHQRQRTIYKVVESLLKFQAEWFKEGTALKPLTLKTVADDIEMHESTVSRVTTRKYLHCPRGLFELKYFFNSSISTGDGAEIASESVKDQIKELIASEDPKKPLSDAKLVALLKAKNIDIARRTVAKYREALGIESSSKRKKIL